jgi:uncharacterized protein (UPF0264 family)
MTRFLASVRSAEEAAVALAGGADIIDAKEPRCGALGRLDDASLRGILREVAGRCPVSATIGDMDLVPAPVAGAVAEMAALGVDIVKVGIFPGEVVATLDALRSFTREGVRLVAVLFADRGPEFPALIARCAAAGFFGVMLDTAEKLAGSLTTHMDERCLAEFVARAHGAGLVSGLAGSLRIADVATLMRIAPDYLGFRSALTRGARSDRLDLEAVRTVRRALDGTRHARDVASSIATATAGAMSAAMEPSSGVATATISSKAV